MSLRERKGKDPFVIWKGQQIKECGYPKKLEKTPYETRKNLEEKGPWVWEFGGGCERDQLCAYPDFYTGTPMPRL